MTLRALLAVLAVILVTGCGGSSNGDFTIRVVAPSGKCWTTMIGDSESTKEGCGTKSFMVGTGYGEADKETPGRWRLRLILIDNGTREVKDSSTTTEPDGAVIVTLPFCC